MVNTLIIPETLSLETFLALPETKPAQEYFNGHIYQKPMPQGKHSKLQITLASQINQQAESKRIAYAFTELRCTFAGRSLVPDITVFEWNHIPLDENSEILNKITIAPDWIIEILSPEQSSLQLVEKISFALKNGTKLGWLISPGDRLVMVFQGDRLPETQTENQILPVLVELENWTITPQIIFNWLNFSQH
ncbi:MAG: Uma2 family endonuclease [Woronichinia naegeliana WA131]|jgi:Uma2 family endonuclease|uniref:Uma2 family endonuclease n=1 Tax=Woronichinia naegeliana WA131 TaxID=2824559 RepID=A0A977KUG7_9CYAN|nr:MAG: Uma2 family endonuclease [Woronichinia naegeliana WA131]